MKYNLTFWQRVALPFLWMAWITRPIYVRKSWHELKKGMEPHKHIYGPVYLFKGYKFRDCTHEGCNMCSAKDDEGNWLDPF